MVKFIDKIKENAEALKWFKRMSLVLGVIVVGWFVIYLVTSNDNLDYGGAKVRESRITASGKTDPVSKNPYFEQKVREHNLQKAKEAEKQGKSYVGIPVITSKENREDLLNIDKEKEEKIKVKRIEQEQVIQEEKPKQIEALSPDEERYLREIKRGIEQEFQLLLQETNQNIFASIKKNNVDFNIKKVSNNENSNPANNRIQENEKKFDIKPGDIFYAVNLLKINSDATSPVVVEIVEGKFKDARVFGSFERFDERLVIRFNKIVTKDGQEIGIDGVAVDPKLSKADVASRVDTHFFERWGGLIASSFISGYAEAVANSGSSSIVSDGGTVSRTIPKYSTRDQTIIASGKVAEKLSNVFAQKFNRAPTVYLDDGIPLAVLILNVNK